MTAKTGGHYFCQNIQFPGKAVNYEAGIFTVNRELKK
jgi:hypothetical protein